MLYKANTLSGYKLDARDGEIGKVKEFYFEDQHWAIRYLVADTGSWLTGRQVLISPHALIRVDEDGRRIDVDLSKRLIEGSPPLNSDKPVSRQFETKYHAYYVWPTPDSRGTLPGITNPNGGDGPGTPKGPTEGEKTSDPHLRSTRAVHGYHVHALDGEMGHVEDFVIDGEGWTIRYLAIDTRDWWPGRKVRVSPNWIDRVSWIESKVFVNLTRESIRLSPEFTDDSLVTGGL